MEERVYDGEIKIQRGIKRIKLNENGDYLELRINDFTLTRRYSEFLEEVQKIINLDKETESLGTSEKLKLLEEKQTMVAQKINSFFGDDICQKAFGTNCPYIDDITDFLMGISELIQKFTGEKISNFKKIEDKYLSKQKARARNSGR